LELSKICTHMDSQRTVVGDGEALLASVKSCSGGGGTAIRSELSKICTRADLQRTGVPGGVGALLAPVKLFAARLDL